MAALEVIALDEATPQLRAPGASDTYTMPRATLIAGGTISGAAATPPALDITQTWNTTGLPTALRMTVTDTASNVSSLLLDLRVGASSVFSINKFGSVNLNSSGLFCTTALGLRITSSGFIICYVVPGTVANTLELRNGANGHRFSPYGTYTDASNYRRVSLALTTGGVATLAPEGAGTGASGNVLHISGLPTSNPGPGILWNNAGTPAIGT